MESVTSAALQAIAKESIGKPVTIDFLPPAVGTVIDAWVEGGNVLAKFNMEGGILQAIVVL